MASQMVFLEKVAFIPFCLHFSGNAATMLPITTLLIRLYYLLSDSVGAPGLALAHLEFGQFGAELNRPFLLPSCHREP